MPFTWGVPNDWNDKVWHRYVTVSENTTFILTIITYFIHRIRQNITSNNMPNYTLSILPYILQHSSKFNALEVKLSQGFNRKMMSY